MKIIILNILYFCAICAGSSKGESWLFRQNSNCIFFPQWNEITIIIRVYKLFDTIKFSFLSLFYKNRKIHFFFSSL
ncbi:hypothetical protein AAZX31_19G051200 [Glycine max]